MAAKCRGRREPGVIFKGGEATAVIQDIDVYQDMLEGLEDAENLIMLIELRQKPLRFRRFEDILDSIEYGRTIN